MRVSSKKKNKTKQSKNSQNQSICQSVLDFSKCEQWITTNTGPLSFILNSNLGTLPSKINHGLAFVSLVSILAAIIILPMSLYRETNNSKKVN